MDTVDTKVVKRFKEITNHDTRDKAAYAGRADSIRRQLLATFRGLRSGVPLELHIEIAPGKAYAIAFNEPDLWGDEAKPHPLGLYRVSFLFYHQLTIEEASLGSLACPLRANPVIFVEK